MFRDTYRAYCMTPSFFSWLGSGTSLRGLPVTLSGGPSASCLGVTAVAELDAEELMKADGAERRGRSAVEGLAIDIPLASGGGTDVEEQNCTNLVAPALSLIWRRRT